MTPQEKDLISQLLDRLKQAGGQPKDAEAEALIKAAMQAQPDAPYLLVQTALIQNMSLEGAQARIAELEQEVVQAREAASRPPTSFLGGLLGGNNPPALQPGQAVARGGSVPRTAGFGQQSPGLVPPVQGLAPQPAGPGGGSFLRTAAMTAAGVAGGALLFHGLSSMFGGSGQGAGAASQGMLGGGQQAGGSSPWGNPQAAGDRSSNDLTAERDPGGHDSAAADGNWDGGDAGGWDDSGFGSDGDL